MTGAADFELDDAFFHGEDDSGMYMHNDVEMQPQTQEEPEETERHKQLFGAESTSQSEDDVSPEKPAASTSQSVGKGKGKEKQPEVQDILNTSEEEDIAYEKEQKEVRSSACKSAFADFAGSWITEEGKESSRLNSQPPDLHWLSSSRLQRTRWHPILRI